MSADFVHLNVHSHYSITRGLPHVVPLVARTIELGMDAIALTDNANMFGALEFFKECGRTKKLDELEPKEAIKGIVGMTCFIVPDHKARGEQDGSKKGRRLTLLARNLEGYKNLCRISSIAYIEGFYYQPRISHAVLEQHKEGLIVLSGGVGSELNEYLTPKASFNQDDPDAVAKLDMRYDDAVEKAKYYRDMLGEGNFYIEMQRTGIEGLDRVEKSLVEISDKLNIPCVATNDVYYLKREDHKTHDVLLCIGNLKLVSEAERPRFSSREFYLKSPEEMAELFRDHPEWVANTRVIADQCNLQFPKKEYHLPPFDPPEGLTRDNFFDLECRRGLTFRYGEDWEKDPVLSARYQEEYKVITDTGYPNYFLIVADFIRKAREMGIPVGPGRGSAAGSIVAYAMEITDIDPIRFDLLFERFLNAQRISMPDIDIDFCQERRQEVIDYVNRRYGSDKVSMIATFGTMGAKGVIRDVMRAFGYEPFESDKISKMIPANPGMSLEKAIAESPDFKNFVENDPNGPEIMEHAWKLEGTVRSVGTHAAGVVIADKDLKEYLPLYCADGKVSTQYTMNSVESDCGLLKMDFLGLQNLTVIRKAVELIRRTHGAELNMRTLELDDAETYELLKRGDTMGVFQFESDGMRNLLRKAEPDRFEDIIALLALYRPGPLGMNMDKQFVECKKGLRPIEYPHPMCEDELKETYGVILYQEQVMRISNKLANFSMQDADILRKAMGKKDMAVMKGLQGQFIEGCTQNGISLKVSEDLFEKMLKFAEYGFNKSHSTAYAYVSYQTAYLKVHYGPEFMAALMSCEMRGKDKILIFRQECEAMGIDVVPPHINHSEYDFSVSDGKVRFGMGGLKGVGENAVRAIVEARKKGGPFTCFEDFLERVNTEHCTKGVIRVLVEAGGLDGLDCSRKQMFDELEEAVDLISSDKKFPGSGELQLTLFDVDVMEKQEPKARERGEEWDALELLRREKAALGYYVSSHPLEPVRRIIRTFSTLTIPQFKEVEAGTKACIAGILTGVKTRPIQNDKRLVTFTVEDLQDSINGVAFPPNNSLMLECYAEDKIVFLLGSAGQDRDGKRQLKVNRVVPIEEFERDLCGALCLHLLREQVTEGELRKLHRLLKRYPGKTPVYINLPTAEGEEVIQMRVPGKLSVEANSELLKELATRYSPQNIELRFNERVVRQGA